VAQTLLNILADQVVYRVRCGLFYINLRTTVADLLDTLR